SRCWRATQPSCQMMGPFLCLWIATFFAVSQGCPEPCTCVEKKYGRQLAECAYRGLQAVPTGLPSNVTTLTLSFTTIAQGTFDAMSSLSQLQIYNNPLNCTCRLLWLKTWAENTLISIPKRDSISCAAPESLRGIPLGKIPKLQCTPPSVQLTYHPNLANTMLYDGVMLMLHYKITIWWVHNWLKDHSQRSYQWFTVKLGRHVYWCPAVVGLAEVSPGFTTIQYFR
uniref:LRRCT domain-containing protein n=1 Tax=Gopherus evgoodei TaxID=1825980 RepID=A0A8C4YPB7_9SAUR